MIHNNILLRADKKTRERLLYSSQKQDSNCKMISTIKFMSWRRLVFWPAIVRLGMHDQQNKDIIR